MSRRFSVESIWLGELSSRDPLISKLVNIRLSIFKILVMTIKAILLEFCSCCSCSCCCCYCCYCCCSCCCYCYCCYCSCCCCCCCYCCCCCCGSSCSSFYSCSNFAESTCLKKWSISNCQRVKNYGCENKAKATTWFKRFLSMNFSDLVERIMSKRSGSLFTFNSSSSSI